MIVIIPGVVIQELDHIKTTTRPIRNLAIAATHWLLAQAKERNQLGRGSIRGQKDAETLLGKNWRTHRNGVSRTFLHCCLSAINALLISSSMTTLSSIAAHTSLIGIMTVVGESFCYLQIETSVSRPKHRVYIPIVPLLTITGMMTCLQYRNPHSDAL